MFTENRKARFDYETLETFDAGIVLTGQEVKSIRNGGVNLEGSYIGFEKGELWLKHAKVRPYAKAGPLPAYQIDHPRKLLLRKHELLRLFGKIQQKGLTLIPFSLYPLRRQIKVRFGLCRGKSTHDKRETIKRRDVNREIRSELMS
jgi:SsrA-binding protein